MAIVGYGMMLLGISGLVIMFNSTCPRYNVFSHTSGGKLVCDNYLTRFLCEHGVMACLFGFAIVLVAVGLASTII